MLHGLCEDSRGSLKCLPTRPCDKHQSSPVLHSSNSVPVEGGGAPRENPGLGDWLGPRPRSVSYLSCGFPASVSPLVQLRLRYAREVCGGSGRRRHLRDPSSALGIETPLKSPPRWAPAPAAYKWAQLPTPAASPASSILLSSLSQACLPRVLRHICKPPAGTRALAISCFLSLTRTHAPA